MSDFGAHVSVYRKDRREPSDEDTRHVHSVARSLQFTARDRIGPYDEYELRFGGARSSDGVEGIAVFLTSYFVEDDNDGLDLEVIMAREAPIVQQFAEELESLLGGEFEAVPYSGNH